MVPFTLAGLSPPPVRAVTQLIKVMDFNQSEIDGIYAICAQFAGMNCLPYFCV